MAKVFVFGAGASKAVSPNAPLNDELLSGALQLQEQPVAGQMARVRKFIADFYPALSSGAPPLEDLLSQLDLAISEGRPLSSEYTVSTLRELRDGLVYGLAEVLRLELEKPHRSDQDANKLLASFVSRLTPEDTIVSLNYDIILDNRILGLVRGEVNYGINIRNGAEQKGENWSWRSYRAGPLFPLYKPHGSLNWLYCPTCRKLDVTSGVKSTRYIFVDPKLVCPECQGRFEPLIITPTMFKSYSNLLVAEIWRDVEDRLSRGSEIIFVGYSLPDADVQFRCILMRALFRNRTRAQANSLPAIRVLGRDKIPPQQYYEGAPNGTHSRYQRLLGDVDFDPTGFLEYMRRGHQTYAEVNNRNRRRTRKKAH